MERKTITKEKLIGMQVIDGEGRLLGTARDFSFTMDGKMFMLIEAKDGRTQEIPWDDIQAASDFVLLKIKPKIGVTPTYATAPTVAAPTAPAGQTLCPTCGRPLRYIDQYKRWWCDNEQKYV